MSNLSRLQSIVDWANIGVVGSLLLSFVFGGASIYLSRRLGTLKDAQSDTAQQKLALELAVQQARAAKAERDLLDVRGKIQGRGLTAEQKTRLFSFLSAKPKERVTFTTFIGDNEAREFALEIVEVLRQIGWQVLPEVYDPQPMPVGLGVFVNPKDTTDSGAILTDALKSIGLDAHRVMKDTTVTNAIILFVGAKPLHYQKRTGMNPVF